jgi:PAS domain S-box-containing protein
MQMLSGRVLDQKILSTARPTGRERILGDDEIIVSKTDPKGRITYANDVFLRMAALGERQALGAPHSVIRHPDMPRAVFKLLWDRIASGREIFAYVVNLAADGDHYWVLAHVTPSFDAAGQILGYHSNRRAPARRAVERLRAVYERLLRIEADGNAKAALAASSAELERMIRAENTDYDRFIFSLAR